MNQGWKLPCKYGGKGFEPGSSDFWAVTPCQGGSSWCPGAFVFVLTPNPPEGGGSQAPRDHEKSRGRSPYHRKQVSRKKRTFCLNMFAFCVITD